MWINYLSKQGIMSEIGTFDMLLYKIAGDTHLIINVIFAVIK